MKGEIIMLKDERLEIALTVVLNCERYEELVRREAYLFSLLRLIHEHEFEDSYNKKIYLAAVDNKCATDAGVNVSLLSATKTGETNE